MKNDNLLDQFFLVDQKVIQLIIGTAELSNKDSVLEIGAGKGIVTRELVKKAGKVIAVEIDKRFDKDLTKIHGKIRVIFADALEVLRENKIKFNKIVGSLPSSIVEPLMHVLSKIDFSLGVFLVPLKFAYKLTNHPVFSLYFDIEIKDKVSRKSFFPVPKTNWALIKLTKKPDALKIGDEERFLRQYVYEHKLAKKKNALREGLIKFYKARQKTLTKNEARKIIETKNPPF